MRPSLLALLIPVVACGARSELRVDGVDAGIDSSVPRDVVDARPSDARAPVCLRCSTRALTAGQPAPSRWYDVAQTNAGWLVVHADEREPDRLIVVVVTEAATTTLTLDMGVEASEPRIAWDAASELALVVFDDGLIWLRADGEVAGGPFVDGRSRGGRPLALGGEYLIWSGNHSVSGSEPLETARLTPLQDDVEWEAWDLLERSTTTPDFERTDEGWVGLARSFRGREALLSWLDPSGNPERWLVISADAGEGRYADDIAVVDGSVALVRTTPRMTSAAPRVVTVDVVTEGGVLERDVLDTAARIDRGNYYLETLSNTAVLVHENDDNRIEMEPIIGPCAGGVIDLGDGAPRFFDGISANEAVMLSTAEDVFRLDLVTCSGD